MELFYNNQILKIISYGIITFKFKIKLLMFCINV